MQAKMIWRKWVRRCSGGIYWTF